MRMSIITTFAVRSLGRNVRRTLLSVLGIAIGCALALLITAFMRGASTMRLQAIAQSGFGHARIAPAQWEKTRDDELRLSDWRAELEAARSMEGVAAAAPHARATALLAFGTNVTGVQMLGVDPPAEIRTSRIVRAIAEGRYLEPGDEGVTVIGSTIAERLDVELDDDLFLTVVRADGEMEYAMLRIVGIIDTGSRELDASICHVTLEELQRLTGFEGAGEITLTFDDPRMIDRLTARLREKIPEGDAVLTWREIIPVQGADAASDRAFMNILIGIVVFVVILGITSAQLTAILERKREFAVMMALGMRGMQVVRLMIVEAAALGLAGAGAGLLLAMPGVYYTATTGLDFGAVMGGEWTMSGVLFDLTMYSDMGVWMIPYALFIALISTLVAGLYPAWYALRTDPTSALSLREA
jgi:ABC-type lipoprotein release transport system permease subunit